ncbi:MAG: SIS domain-containing protein [Acidobacteriota bacterium]
MKNGKANPARPLVGDLGLDDYIDIERANDRWDELFVEAEYIKGEPAYTPREILQQPWTWWQSAQMGARRFSDLVSIFQEADRVYLTGAGSSFFIGRSLEQALQVRSGKPVTSVAATELILDPSIYLAPNVRGLLVSFSRSGESPESLEAIRAVQEIYPQYQHLVITANSAGKLVGEFVGSRGVHVLALHPATCDRGLAMTSSFTNMVVAGQIFAFANADDYLDHVWSLRQTGREVLAKVAGTAQDLADLAPSRVCLLGAGTLGGAAAEGALKVLEMTDGRVSTLSDSFLGIRHGPLSFLDEETIMIYFVSSEKSIRRHYERDLMEEVKLKGLARHRVAVGYDLEGSILDLVDTRIDFGGWSESRVPDDLLPPLNVLPCQTLALALCLNRSLDPDNPSRRGVINRVVEGINIYKQ